MFKIPLLLFCFIFPTFNEAKQEAAKNDKPILVIVTGNSCAPCEILKNRVIEPMSNNNEFGSVNIASVNIDTDPDVVIVNELLNGRRIKPQVILFYKTNNKWRRATIIGNDPNSGVMRQRILNLMKLGGK